MRSFEPTVVDHRFSPNDMYVHYGHTSETALLLPIQFGYMATVPEYGYGPIIRDHYLIHFILRGRGRLAACGREYSAGAGDCFAIFPHQITYYQASQDEPWEYYWLGFEGKWAEEMMKKSGFEGERLVRKMIDERIVDTFGLLKEGMDKEDFFVLLCGAVWKVLYMLGATAKNLPPAEFNVLPESASNEYVQTLISIIHNSYGERINISALAERLGLNRSYMSELFHRHTGRSIKAYLVEYRLQRSLLALQFPDYSIKRVALECGFSDALYFSRAFKQRFGMSPEAYRKNKM